MHARVLAVALLALPAACRCDDGGLETLVSALAVDRTRVEFPDTFVGAAPQETLRLTSVGTGTAHITAVAVAGDAAFSRKSDVPEALRRGEAADAILVFAPSAAGEHSATLVIESDSVTAPRLEVVLTGLGLEPPPCDDDNECTHDTFEPTAGVCLHENRTGTCDDESACTENDRCLDGACVGDAIACDDGVTCTLDLCDPDSGCAFPPAPDACDDGAPCTLDVCDPSTATLLDPSGCTFPPAPDGTPCGEFTQCGSIDLCIAQICSSVPIPDDTPCSDGDICTADDVCAAGACAGVPTARPPEVIFESFRAVDTFHGQFPGNENPPFAIVDDILVFGDRVLKSVPLSALPLAVTGHQPVVDLPLEIVPIGDGRVAVTTFVPPAGAWNNAGTDSYLHIVRAADLGVERSLAFEESYLHLLGAADGFAYACLGRQSFLNADLLVVPLDGSEPVRFAGDAACVARAEGNGRVAIRLGVVPLQIIRLTPTGSILAATFDRPGDGVPALPDTFHFALVGEARAVITSAQVSGMLVVDITDPEAPVVGATAGPAMSRPLAFLDDGDAVLVRYSFSQEIYKHRIDDVTNIRQDTTFSFEPQGTPPREALLKVNGTLSVVGGNGSYLPLPDGNLSALVETEDGLRPLIGVSATGVTAIPVAALGEALPLPQVPIPLVSTLVGGGAGPSSLFVPSRNASAPDPPTRWPFDGIGFLDPGVRTLHDDQANTLATVQFLASGAVIQWSTLQVVFPSGLSDVTQLEAVAVSGCIGAALAVANDADGNARVHGVPLTVCASPATVLPLATLPIPELDPLIPDIVWDGRHYVRKVSGTDHGDTVSFLADGHAVLFDFSSPTTPIVRAAIDDPSFTGAYLSAGEDADTWVLVATPLSGSPILWVYDVSVPGAPVLRLRTGLPITDPPDAVAGTVRRRVLGVAWPRAYISDWDDTESFERGHSVTSWDLSAEPPVLVDRLPVASAPTDAAFVDDTVVISRVDGLSVISPPCGP